MAFLRASFGGGGGGSTDDSDDTDSSTDTQDNQTAGIDPFLQLRQGGSGGSGGSDSSDDQPSDREQIQRLNMGESTETTDDDTQQSDQKGRLRSKLGAGDQQTEDTKKDQNEKAKKNQQEKGKKTDKGLGAKAWGVVAGASDFAALNFDEKAGRQFNDQNEKAKKKDQTTTQKAHTWLANAGDFVAGKSDEATSRSHDSQKGGGLWTGFNENTKVGFDAVLDNPVVSVQDTVRGGVEGGVEVATGKNLKKGDMAKAAQQFATKFRKQSSSVTEGTMAEPVTDTAVFLGDAVVADPAKTVVEATTGIDVDKGTAEAEVGAVEAADVGLSVVGGSAGTSLAKSIAAGEDLVGLSDDAATATAKSGDDATTTAAKTGDDATTTAAKTGDDATATADDLGTDSFGRLTKSGETVTDTSRVGAALGLADDAAGTGDDLFSGLKSRLLKTSDETAATSDDAAATGEDAVATGEDAASAGEDAVATGEDAVNVGEDAASAGDDAGGGVRNWLKTNSGKVGFTAGATAATGLAFTSPQNAPKNITTSGGKTLSATKTYDATKRFPNGGRLYAVTGKDGQKLGYWTLVGVRGRNLIVLDSDGSTRRAKISIEQFKKLKSGNAGGGGN